MFVTKTPKQPKMNHSTLPLTSPPLSHNITHYTLHKTSHIRLHITSNTPSSSSSHTKLNLPLPYAMSLLISNNISVKAIVIFILICSEMMYNYCVGLEMIEIME